MYEEIDEDEQNWWEDPDETEEERLQREKEEELSFLGSSMEVTSYFKYNLYDPKNELK